MTSPLPADPVGRLRELYSSLQSLGFSLYKIQQETGISRAWSSAFLTKLRPDMLSRTAADRLEKLEALLKKAQDSQQIA